MKGSQILIAQGSLEADIRPVAMNVWVFLRQKIVLTRQEIVLV